MTPGGRNFNDFPESQLTKNIFDTEVKKYSFYIHFWSVSDTPSQSFIILGVSIDISDTRVPASLNASL